jgi:pyruvate,orthophosphate dikinase
LSGKQRIYFFGGGQAEGSASMKALLGGKGAGLAEMSRLGIPVPPGFTVSTEVCTAYLADPAGVWKSLEPEIFSFMQRLEKARGLGFGSPSNPLLVSVRSGAVFSMPGMMDTILNLGLNDESVEGLARRTDNERFALDCYRRLIEKYGEIVKGLSGEPFETSLEEARKKRGARHDHELTAEDLRALVRRYLGIYRGGAGQDFPQDVRQQLREALDAVFRSWNNSRAQTYRRLHQIPDGLGTAVTVQSMVFGNLGGASATGVAFTRNPSTGENLLYGEYLPNAQGEDVVAGIRTPYPLNRATAGTSTGPTMEETLPAAYRELVGVRERLEKHYRDMLDIEFTVEEGSLFMLQSRVGKRTGAAALRMACEMAEEGLIGPSEAVMRVEPAHLEQLLAPAFDAAAREAAAREGRIAARGLPAGPGAASGRIALSAARAVEMHKKGEKVLLVRVETSPEDVAGMSAAAGILTSRGGMTSHAAVVARGMGKPCVTGCGALDIDYGRGIVHVAGRALREGEALSIDGTSGEVIAGALQASPSEISRCVAEGAAPSKQTPMYGLFVKFMAWVDEARRMGVRANADTPEDAALARRMGAQGIGLCRTEHMFFGEERIAAMREMILARHTDERRKALEKLLPYQRSDFEGILRAMHGLPVTIRLLDPPLHEFLPHDSHVAAGLARRMGVTAEEVAAKAEAIRETNPMLGHRGCRLALTYPEIYEMQARAIFEASATLQAEGLSVEPEVMVPLVSDPRELAFLRGCIEAVAHEVEKRTGRRLSYRVGTMIEIPRACVMAEEIARHADFFSFGTNDLTQMTYGFSRDDSGSFLPTYVERAVLEHDPFQRLDQRGVGELMRMGAQRGRVGNAALKVGICGEHGGEPSSVRFCHRIGLNYVSCSPYRLPIARLAAAQAALEEKGTTHGDTR